MSIVTKFELSENEVNAAEKFLAKLPKKYKNEPKEIIFSFGDGIGIGVIIKVLDKQKNITDYSLW